MERMATALAKSGLFGMKTPDQALALMVVAQAEGRHPGSIAGEYHIIQGRASLKADAMLARFQSAGGRVEWHDHTDQLVSATFSHPAGGSLKIDWDMARAKSAGLGTKDNWRQYPRQMLRARVISEGVRAVYPGVLQGMYTPEEVEEFKPAAKPAVAVELLPAANQAPEETKAANCDQLEVVAEPPKKRVRYHHIKVPQEAAVVEAKPEPSDKIKELERRVFEYEPRVNSFLVSRGMIAAGQTFRDIADEAYLDRVLLNTEKFLLAVKSETKPAEEAAEQKEAA